MIMSKLFLINLKLNWESMNNFTMCNKCSSIKLNLVEDDLFNVPNESFHIRFNLKQYYEINSNISINGIQNLIRGYLDRDFFLPANSNFISPDLLGPKTFEIFKLYPKLLKNLH